MAKIVVLSIPAHGHVNPVAPVVAELVRRGHDVLVANDAELAGKSMSGGARFRPYPPAMSLADVTRVLADGNLIAFFELLLEATVPLFDFTLSLLAEEKPDLVVFDGACLWGEMAARRLAVKRVSTMPFFIFELLRNSAGPREMLGFTRRFLPRLHRLALGWGRILSRGVDLLPLQSPMFPLRGDLNILFSTREIHPPTRAFNESFAFVGASIDTRTRPEQFDLSPYSGERIVYFSLGTLHHTNDRLLRQVIAALAERPLRLLVSTGPGDVMRLGPLPGNVVVRPSFPQIDVLRQAEAFITHAGLNSVHESLWAGVPMVALPQQFEQLRNALTVSRKGAGLTVADEAYGRPASGAAVAAALDRVLAEPAFRARARQLGASLHSAGGFVEAADRIEALLNSHQRQRIKHAA